jgi:hypothetical protein
VSQAARRPDILPFERPCRAGASAGGVSSRRRLGCWIGTFLAGVLAALVASHFGAPGAKLGAPRAGARGTAVPVPGGGTLTRHAGAVLTVQARTVRVDQGRIDVDTRAAAPVRVEVAGLELGLESGGRFTVDAPRSGEALELSVLEGVAVVRGPGLPGGERRFAAGERWSRVIDPGASAARAVPGAGPSNR